MREHSVDAQSPDIVILEATGLTKHFNLRRSISAMVKRDPVDVIRAVDNISLSVKSSTVFGIAGESGSGKTVTSEMLAGLQQPTSGSIFYNGQSVAEFSRADYRQFRRDVSMVFQDPFDSLNPRWTVLEAVQEPLRIHKVGGDSKKRRERVLKTLDLVQLSPADFYASKYPHELSGGERQRVAIARSLILEPRVVIADEPTTMLDVSIRAGLLNLLHDLQRDLGLTLIYISHDFSTLGYLCDHLAIMYRGVVVEEGPARDVLDDPKHPYTRALASAIPRPDPRFQRPRVRVRREQLESSGETGCRFTSRCPDVMERCGDVEPDLINLDPDRRVACFLYEPDHVAERSSPGRLASDPQPQVGTQAVGGEEG